MVTCLGFVSSHLSRGIESYPQDLQRTRDPNLKLWLKIINNVTVISKLYKQIHVLQTPLKLPNARRTTETFERLVHKKIVRALHKVQCNLYPSIMHLLKSHCNLVLQ